MAFIATVVAAKRSLVVATRTVAMLHRLAVVMPRSPVVAIVVARRAVAAKIVAARRADAARAVAARRIDAARAAATSATPVVVTKADAMPLPLVVPSPPVAVALLVRPMPSRCLPRRSPMLPR